MLQYELVCIKDYASVIKTVNIRDYLLCSLLDGNVEIWKQFEEFRFLIYEHRISVLNDAAAVQLKLHSYTLWWNWSFVSRSGWSCLYLLCPVEYFVRVTQFSWFHLCNVYIWIIEALQYHASVLLCNLSKILKNKVQFILKALIFLSNSIILMWINNFLINLITYLFFK